MNTKQIKKELKAICMGFGVKPGGYDSTWEELAALAIVHSSGALIRDFTAYLEEYMGDDFPQGAISKYVYAAPDRLSARSATRLAVAADPEVVSLARELTHASESVVAFQDKQRARLGEVLKEFSAAEIKSAFSAWLDGQDLSDPKNVSYLAGKFVQIADSLCYAARRKKQETDEARILRDQMAARLQAEAEQERLAATEREKLVEDFDPFAKSSN